MEIPSRRRRACRLAVSAIAIAIAICGCGSSHRQTGSTQPVSARALLLAYGAPFVDLRHGDAARLCGDFTPAAARGLAVFPSRTPASAQGRSCLTTLGHLFEVSGQRGRDPGFGLTQELRVIGITGVQADRASATAVLENRLARGAGGRVHFTLLAGRWRVAQTPHLEGAFFNCPPHGGLRCRGAAMFSLLF